MRCSMQECPVGQTHCLLGMAHFPFANMAIFLYIMNDWCQTSPLPNFITVASGTLSQSSSLSYYLYTRHEQGFCGIHSKASHMSRINRFGHRRCANRCWSRRTSPGWKQKIIPIGLGGDRVLDWFQRCLHCIISRYQLVICCESFQTDTLEILHRSSNPVSTVSNTVQTLQSVLALTGTWSLIVGLALAPPGFLP